MKLKHAGRRQESDADSGRKETRRWQEGEQKKARLMEQWWVQHGGAIALGCWLFLLPVAGLAQDSLGREEGRTAGEPAPQRRAKHVRSKAVAGRRASSGRNAQRGREASDSGGAEGRQADGQEPSRPKPGGETRLVSAGNSGGGVSRSPEVKVTTESVTHRLRLAPHGVIVVEFPLADALYAVHPGNQNIVEVDIDKDHKPNDPIVFRPGPNFDPALKTQTVHSLQFISGLFVTLIFEPTDRIENNDHRVILQYDIARIRGIRAEKGLATNLVRRPVSPLLEEDPKQQPLPPTQPELFPPLPPAEPRKTGLPTNQAQLPAPGPAPEPRPETVPRQAPPPPAARPPLPPPPVPVSALPGGGREDGTMARANGSQPGRESGGNSDGGGNQLQEGGRPEQVQTAGGEKRPTEAEQRVPQRALTGQEPRGRAAPAPSYREPLPPSFAWLGLQLEEEERRQSTVQSPRPAVDGENGRILYPQSEKTPEKTTDGRHEKDRKEGGKHAGDRSHIPVTQRTERSARRDSETGVELHSLDQWGGQERPTPVLRQWHSQPDKSTGGNAIQRVQYGGPGPVTSPQATGPTPAEREKYRLLLEYYQSLGLSITQMHALRGDLERRVQHHLRQKSANWLAASEIKQARQTFSRWPAMVCFVEIVDEPDFPGLRRYVLSITVHEKAERPVYLSSLEPDVFVVTRNGKNIVNTERLLPLVTLAGNIDSVIRPGETAYFGVAIPRPVLSDNQLLEIGFIDAEKANRPILAREFRIRRP